MVKHFAIKDFDRPIFFSVALRHSVSHNPKAMAKPTTKSFYLCFIFILIEGKSKLLKNPRKIFKPNSSDSFTNSVSNHESTILFSTKMNVDIYIKSK